MNDKFNMKKKWTITKFNDLDSFLQNAPYDISVFHENLLLNEGIGAMLLLLTGGSATPFNNLNTQLGVGDSSTAEVATQTGLQATTNKQYIPMQVGYPTITGQTITFQSVFTGSYGNFAWNEFTVANGNSDAAINLNRKVATQGVKSAGMIWTLTLGITFS
jgi:hypothetical protein